MNKNGFLKKCLCFSMVFSILATSTSVTLASIKAQQDNDKYVVSDNKKEQQNKWFKKVQAESGEKAGAVIFEKPGNVNSSGTLARYIGNGEQNSLTITVNTDFEDTVKMKFRYVSGENRSISYKVNDGDPVTVQNLNSGSWDTLKDSEEFDIQLKNGQNKIKFYLTEGHAPDIDYITFSRNGATEEDVEIKQELNVRFMANDEQIGESFVKRLNETITLDNVPADPTKEGKDFLGWYFGENLKYEAIFPLDLSQVPREVIESLDGQLTLTARFGKNIAPNPVEKDGYRLIFQEEFDGTQLDSNKWVDKYLSSWSTQAHNTKEWEIKDGEMNLQIKSTTNPWCPEYDGQTVVSGFSTGQRNGLHNWNRNNKVRNPSDTELTHINQYGYYEIRAKGQSGSSRHSAWWLLGFEDVPEESAEIDIFEILGNNNHAVPAALHAWNDDNPFRNPDFGLGAYRDPNKDFNNEYHVYGFDWQKGTGQGALPDKIIFYIDGVKWKEENVNIDYPMIQLFSLYEKRAGGWTGAWEWMPYPNSFNIDYVRVYKKLPDGAKPLPQDELKVLNVRAEDVQIKENEIELKTYGDYTEKNLPGTKSYVRVDWNDGVETQEPVQWDPITKEDLDALKSGKSIVKRGRVPSINKEVQMNINVIPKEPYTINKLNPLSKNSLSYVFDGFINEPDAKSGEFRFVDSIRNDNIYFEYDFKNDVELSGVNIWTNFGADQGIKKAKISTFNEQTNSWEFVKDENNNDKEYILNWTTREERAEKVTLDVPQITTSKVRIHVLDANTKWNQKFTVREINFNKRELNPVLENLELTPPTKTEYNRLEELDLSGMQVNAVYSDGTKVDVTDRVTVSDVDMSTVGQKVVTVTFEGKSASFNINVNENTQEKPQEDNNTQEKPQEDNNTQEKPQDDNNTQEKPQEDNNKPATPNEQNNQDKVQNKPNKSQIVQTSDDVHFALTLVALSSFLISVVVFLKKKFKF